MSEQSLALLREQVPSGEAMAGMLAVATSLVESGMVPVGIKKPGQALALILTGREMGIGPMRSVQDLYHVKGNVGMLTRFMIAQFRLAGHYHEVLIKTATHCKVVLHLKEGREVIVELTRAEVDALGYTTQKEYRGEYPNSKWTGQWVTKPQWKKDPAGMLCNRTMTRGIRDHAPECLYGMLTQEEIQDRGIAAGESRLVSFLKEHYPDVWTEWAQIQLRIDLAEAAKREAINGDAREIPQAGDNGDQQPPGEARPQKHWMDCVDTTGRAVRTVFWTWVLEEVGLQMGEVHKALGTTVEQEFPSMQETKDLVQAYVNKYAQPAEEPPDQEVPIDGPPTQDHFLDEADIPFE